MHNYFVLARKLNYGVNRNVLYMLASDFQGDKTGEKMTECKAIRQKERQAPVLWRSISDPFKL